MPSFLSVMFILYSSYCLTICPVHSKAFHFMSSLSVMFILYSSYCLTICPVNSTSFHFMSSLSVFLFRLFLLTDTLSFSSNIFSFYRPTCLFFFIILSYRLSLFSLTFFLLFLTLSYSFLLFLTFY